MESHAMIQVRPPRFGRVLLLASFFLAALYLRLRFLSLGPFHYDAMDLALCAEKTLKTGLLHYEHGTGFPLTVMVGAFFVWVGRLLGVTDPVLCVNGMSAFMGALNVLLLFLVVERMFDSSRASFAAALLVFFAPHLAISTFAKSLTLSICFALASVYFALGYVKDESRPPKDLLLSAVFLGFCGAARFSDLVMGLPVFFLLVTHERWSRASWGRWLSWGALVFLTAGLYYVPLLIDKGLTPFIETMTQESQAKYCGIFSLIFRRSLKWIYGYWHAYGLAMIAAGFVFMASHRRIKHLLFLFVWFLTAQLFYGSVSSSGPRYLIIGWLALIAAQGYFLGSFRGWRRLLALMVLLFSVSFGLRPYLTTLESRHRWSPHRDFALWVSSVTRPEDTILAMDERIFIEHYGRRRVLQHPLTCDPKLVEEFFDEVDGLLASGQRVFAAETFFSYDECGIFQKTAKKRYKITSVGYKMSEDWHHTLLTQLIFRDYLWEFKKR
jgi:hypothetical protein